MPLRGIRLVHVCLFLVGAVVLYSHSTPAANSLQDPQRPPFRTGTNVVRVDAYPTRDGKIIEGLKADDFEVLEDGVVQKISTFEFVRFPQSNPIEERRDPNSQREGFQLAADPSYRVFVIYLDNLHVDFAGSHAVRAPLINFLNRVLGPKDLFGVITTRNSVNDLMLGQKTDFIEEQLTKHWDWGRGARVLEDEADQILEACGLGGLIPHRRLDEVFSDLEGLMTTLAGVREERKNILLISNGWPLPGPAHLAYTGKKPMMPQPGVTNAGKITLGARNPGEVSGKMCEDLRAHLAPIDFQRRMRDLLQLARESNVTFYNLRPSGLVAAASAFGQDMDRLRVDSLRILSDNTDGIAVVNTNDLTTGAMKIAEDLAAVYYLGYSPSNTKADGRVRQITVRLKGSGDKVRARREYRAPSESDIAAMRATIAAAAAPPAPASPVEGALAELKRLRPSAVLHTRGSIVGDEFVVTTELTSPEIEAGRWKSGGEVQIVVSTDTGDILTTARSRIEPGQRAATARVPLNKLAGPFNAAVRLRNDVDGSAQDGVSVARATGLFGDPLLFRLTTPANARAAGSVQFRRTERLQARWPVLGAVEQRSARLLGRDGVPLELAVALTEREDNGVTFAVADLNLAPLTAGEYVLEVSGTRGSERGAAHLAFRVSR